jgi:hypothetical protein
VLRHSAQGLAEILENAPNSVFVGIRQGAPCGRMPSIFNDLLVIESHQKLC